MATYELGDRVTHETQTEKYGDGTVVRETAKTVHVHWDKHVTRDGKEVSGVY